MTIRINAKGFGWIACNEAGINALFRYCKEHGLQDEHGVIHYSDIVSIALLKHIALLEELDAKHV